MPSIDLHHKPHVPVPVAAPIKEKVVQSEKLSRGQFIYAYSLITALFFAWGFAYGLVDSLNKHFQNVFGINHAQSTWMQVAYFGAYFIWAPFAGLFMRRVGYKNGIYAGLTLYTLGSFFFWPVAVKRSYPGFVICTFGISMGLSTLEVAANTYITVLGDPKYGALRLTFSQSWNGVGTFAGPLIASHTFYKGENSTSLGSVQYVYLAVGCFGVFLMVLFYLAKLPEIDEASLSDTLLNQQDVDPLWKQPHTYFGFVAQFAYVGAQVAIATFAVNYFADFIHYSDSKAANWFSYLQMVFTLGRFMGAGVLRFVNPAHALAFYGGMCTLFCALVLATTGTASVTCMFFLFYFESICWPTIYSLAIARLGKHTKLGGSLVVAGVGGGALYAPTQGVLADRKGVHQSYYVALTGYIVTLAYGVGMSIDVYRRRNIDFKTGKLKTAASAEPTPRTVEEADRTSDDEKIREEGVRVEDAKVDA